MPFVQVNVKQQIEEERQKDPEFKKAWDESRAEYKLIGEMISLRKQEKMSQRELARITGNSQQVISSIETMKNIPTIKMFSKMLDALGYELRIEKKNNA